MGLDLTSLRNGIYKPIGIEPNSPEMPFVDVDLYLNRAFWEIQNKFPLKEKHVTSTFQTTAGIRNYDVSYPTEAVLHIAIEEPTRKEHIPLDKITANTYESIYRDDEEEWGMPTKFVLEGCIVRFWRTPDQEYTVIIRRLVALNDLGVLVTTPNVPNVWHEIILYGGLWRAYIDVGDHVRANNIKLLQSELINTIVPTEAKEEQTNTSLAHVEVLGRDY